MKSEYWLHACDGFNIGMWVVICTQELFKDKKYFSMFTFMIGLFYIGLMATFLIHDSP